MANTPVRRRRHKLSGWLPNQHGAWSMLIGPAVVGLIGRLVREPSWVVVPVLVAWFAGYFAFFASGLWAHARNPNRKRGFARPMCVYAAIALVAVVVALVLQPNLAWAAVIYAPLMTIAVGEMLRGRSRSVLSGFSTTAASGLLVWVLAGGVQWWSDPALGPALILVFYFMGTITFVKSTIREKGNRGFYWFSVAFHTVVMVAGAVITPWALLPLGAATARAAVIPRRILTAAVAGRAWSAKRIGLTEVPFFLLSCITVVLLLLVGRG